MALRRSLAVAFVALTLFAPASFADPVLSDVRASELLGKPVFDADGKALGELEDLVLELNGERVRYAVIGPGRALGLGEDRKAYLLTTLRLQGHERLVVDGAAMPRPHRRSAGIPASEIIGRKVQHKDGAHLGEIRDLTVNLGTGYVNHVMVQLARRGTELMVPALSIALPADGAGRAIVTGPASTGATRAE